MLRSFISNAVTLIFCISHKICRFNELTFLVIYCIRIHSYAQYIFTLHYYNFIIPAGTLTAKQIDTIDSGWQHCPAIIIYSRDNPNPLTSHLNCIVAAAATATALSTELFLARFSVSSSSVNTINLFRSQCTYTTNKYFSNARNNNKIHTHTHLPSKSPQPTHHIYTMYHRMFSLSILVKHDTLSSVQLN